MRSTITNPNPSTDWSVGDSCTYYVAYTGTMSSGVITSIDENNIVTVKDLTSKGTRSCLMECLFKTHSKAMDALIKHNDNKFNTYKSSIKDLDTLLAFALEHCIARAEEYTDWEARAAFIERARELYNVELNKD